MKKAICSSIVFFLFMMLVFFISSCSKSSPAPSSSFTWTYNNNAAISAAFHKAYHGSATADPVIVASKNSALSGYDILITASSLNTGTYILSESGSNTLQYVDTSGIVLNANSGTLDITINSNSSVSGNFVAVANDIFSIPRNITGSFVQTPVQP